MTKNNQAPKDVMVFDNLRRSRNVEALGAHLARMKSLEHTRDEYEAENRYDMVLAVNYELASEATRTLLVIRKLEELGGVFESPADVEPLRAAMQHFTNLPAIRRSEIGSKSPFEIGALYAQYQIAEAARAGKSPEPQARTTEPPPEPKPKPALRQAPTDVWTPERIISTFSVTQQQFDVNPDPAVAAH